MMETVEIQVSYVPFAQIVNESDYRFRLSDEKFTASLKNTLVKSGQTHPLLLEEISDNQYRILDGHRRYDAIRLVREQGGTWEKMLALVIPQQETTALERFRRIKARNMTSDNGFGLFEKAAFFKKFYEEGLTIKTIAEECAMTIHATEDAIELAAARPALGALINGAAIETTHALMLHHRYEAWMSTPHAPHADAAVHRILDHVRNEKPTIKSWRFLLDFYWRKDRPFQAGRLKLS